MIRIDGNQLQIDDVLTVARFAEKVELSESAQEGMERSCTWVEEIAASEKPVYGINTGFGIFADQRISSEDTRQLNRNLILSHAVSTGPALSKEIVRSAMLIRANTLASGYSGVRVLIVETILSMLNKGVTPIIPSQGSLGSSGDLAPLSHLALVFTTDNNDLDEESGEADYQGKVTSGKSAMQAARIPRIVLGPKEGLAINNGATFSSAIASLAVSDTSYLLEIAELSLSMSLEAMLGVSDAFLPRIHEIRHHPGQIEVASNVLKLTKGSTLIDSAGKIQDSYSLRCAPQVQGAARDTYQYVRDVVHREINAVTDNPIILGAGKAISGGNFHGEPIGMVMDFLGIAIAEVGAISERRIFRLTDAKLNAGLPAMLVDSLDAAGLNSGMMMPQYTAASLVLENQTLANADSVHSLPTSAEQEDHNANSMTAARHTREIINNTSHILAIELYCATRALDLRLRDNPQAKMGEGVAVAYHKIREVVPYREGDTWWGPEIEIVHQMIRDRQFKF